MFRLLMAAFLFLAPLSARAGEVLATYWTNSGSLPPEYAWDVTVTIEATGKVTLRRCTGYETSGPACKTRTGKANAAQLEAIRLAVADSGLLEKPAREAEDFPIGGGSSGGEVLIDGQSVELPPFPADPDVKRVAAVLSAVYAAIPERLRARYIEAN